MRYRRCKVKNIDTGKNIEIYLSTNDAVVGRKIKAKGTTLIVESISPFSTTEESIKNALNTIKVERDE